MEIPGAARLPVPEPRGRAPRCGPALPGHRGRCGPGGASAPAGAGGRSGEGEQSETPNLAGCFWSFALEFAEGLLWLSRV